MTKPSHEIKRTVTVSVTTQFSSSSCVLYSCKPSEILPHKGGVDSTKALRKGEMESSPWITIRTWKNCRNHQKPDIYCSQTNNFQNLISTETGIFEGLQYAAVEEQR